MSLRTSSATAWGDRLQGVLFAGAGTVASPVGSGYDGLFTEERFYSEVGYGLRLHTLAFGALQYLVALDLAIPLSPSVRRYEVPTSDGGVELVDRAPFRLVFGIMQTY